MKCKILIIFSIFSLTVSCQSTFYGTYESKQGSTLILNKDKSFVYQRFQSKTELDIISLEHEYDAYGKFKIKDDLLYLTSDKLNLEDNSNFKVKEIDIELTRKWNDSINITVDYNDDLVSIYLCNTSNEINLDWEDQSNCHKLNKKNKVKGFYNNYFFRIYPNIESHVMRTKTSINTIYFDSNYLNKEIENDLEIEINFDIKNFGLVFFKKEFLLMKGNKIYHEGQEFILEKSPSKDN